MKKNIRLMTYAALGGFLFVLDQFLKYLAFHNQEYTYYIWKPFIGWNFFANPGIAFGIPIPQWLIIIISPAIIILLTAWASQEKKRKNTFYLAIILVITGALSNFIDRILFSITIDYFRVFTSVLNLADILIVIGAAMLILRKSK